MTLWTRLVFVARLLVAIATFLAGSALALSKLGIIPENDDFEIWALIVGLVVIFVDTVGTMISRHFARRRQLMLQDVHTTCLAMLRTVADATGLKLEMIGVSVFIPRRQVRFRRRLAFVHSPTELWRLKRLRISDYPQQSGVRWTSGKGAVGEAWKENRIVHREWAPIAKRWADVEITEAAFRKMSAATRQGFTLAEFRAIVDKYAEVLALPIWRDGTRKTLGVLAIDFPFDRDPIAIQGRHLNTSPIKYAASTCASVVGNTLAKKYAEQ